jgi:hypothetical protein
MLSQRTFSPLIVALVVLVGRGVKAQDVDSKVRVVTSGPFAGLACGFADGDAGTPLQAIHKDKWSGTVSHFDISVCPKPTRAKVDPAIRSLISYPLVVSVVVAVTGRDGVYCLAVGAAATLLFAVSHVPEADARDVFQNAMRSGVSEPCTEKRRKSGAALSI